METRTKDREISRAWAVAVLAAATLLALCLVAAAPIIAPASAQPLAPREWVVAANYDGQLSVIDSKTDLSLIHI